jgi:hypothetical protein
MLFIFIYFKETEFGVMCTQVWVCTHKQALCCEICGFHSVDDVEVSGL